MNIEPGPQKGFFSIFLPDCSLVINYISTLLQLLEGKRHSTDNSAKLKTHKGVGL